MARTPPPEHPVRTYPFPVLADQVLVEWVTSELANSSPLEPGTPHPNQREFAGFKLGIQRVNPADHNFHQRIWVTDATGEDTYNYALKFGAESNSHPIYVRSYRVLREGYAPLEKGSALDGQPGAILVSEEANQYPIESEYFANYLNVIRVYETLPGPWLPFTRYDDDLGPIQGRRRAVVNTGQAAVLGPESKTTYEARDGSSFVSWQIEEGWDDDLFPATDGDFHEPDRGPVQRRSQLVVRTGDEEGSLVTAGGIATKTIYEAYNAYLVRRIVETWGVPGPVLRNADRYDELLGRISGTRQLVEATGQVQTYSATGQTRYEASAYGDTLVWEIVEEWNTATFPTTANGLWDGERGAFHQVSQLVIETGSEVASSSVSAGVATKITYEAYNEFLLKRIVETWAVPGPTLTDKDTNARKQTVTKTRQRVATPAATPTATQDVVVTDLGGGEFREEVASVASVFDEHSYEAERPDTVPQDFRAATPIETTDEIVAGTAAAPTLGAGELQKSETQITAFTKRMRNRLRSLVGLPVSLIGKETNREKQEVTVTRTLRTAGTDPVPTATQDVEVENLGDGNVVETKREIPEVFAANVFEKEVPDAIPPDFRAALPVTTTDETSEGTAAEPTLATGDLSAREQQVDSFLKRVLRRTRAAITLPVSLVSYRTNQQKQLETVTRTLKVTGAATAPTATREVETQNLGDGRMVETIAEKPEVFTGAEYAAAVPDVIPPEFRAAAPITTTEETVAGTATMPTLGTGDVEAVERQLDEFLKRTVLRSRASITLPVVLTGKATNNERQVVTITKTLRAAGTDALPSATQEVDVEALGDGNVIETKRSVSAVFAASESGSVQDSAVPRKFLNVTGEVITESTAAGAQVADTLGSDGLGVVESVVRWLDSFRTRKRTRARVGSLVTSLTEYRLNADGQLVTIVTALGSGGAPTVTATTEVAEVEGVGDGQFVSRVGTVGELLDKAEFRIEKDETLPARFRAAMPAVTERHLVAGAAEAPTLEGDEIAQSERQLDATKKETSVTTRDVSAPPTLGGQDYDATLDTVVQYSETIEDAGVSLGTNRKDVQPLGGGKDLVRTIAPPEAELDAYLLSIPGTTSVNLPDVLEDVTITFEKETGEGGYDETGSGFSTGDSASLSLNLSADAQGSAVIVPNAQVNIKQVWGQDIPCVHHFFFLPNPVTQADILSKVGATSWPVFQPQAHTITLKGGSLSLKTRANVQQHASISSSNTSRTKGQGSGTSRAVGATIRTVHIPPTIHASIPFNTTTETEDVEVSATADMAGTTNWDAMSKTEQASGTVTGTVSPSSLGATTPSAIPTSGVRLKHVDVDPYKWGYSRVHAITVDFAVFA